MALPGLANLPRLLSWMTTCKICGMESNRIGLVNDFALILLATACPVLVGTKIYPRVGI